MYIILSLLFIVKDKKARFRGTITGISEKEKGTSLAAVATSRSHSGVDIKTQSSAKSWASDSVEKICVSFSTPAE
jgi:hypothetical protein